MCAIFFYFKFYFPFHFNEYEKKKKDFRFTLCPLLSGQKKNKQFFSFALLV